MSYLDLCITDNRLQLEGLIQGKLNIADYDSDHKAIVFNISLQAPLVQNDQTNNLQTKPL